MSTGSNASHGAGSKRAKFGFGPRMLKIQRQIETSCWPRRDTATSSGNGDENENAALAISKALEIFKKEKSKNGLRGHLIRNCHKILRSQYPKFVTNAMMGIEGELPDVKPGFQTRYRAQLSLLGIHRPPIKGIDFKDVRTIDGTMRMALSVVDTGKYEDSIDHGDQVIYVGEGGLDQVLKTQVDHQTTGSPGNDALLYNKLHKKPVRLIRGKKVKGQMLYTYSGLYDVTKLDKTRGKAGFIVCKFTLERRKLK